MSGIVYFSPLQNLLTSRWYRFLPHSRPIHLHPLEEQTSCKLDVFASRLERF